MIYLDHAATTPVPRAVADTMYTVTRSTSETPAPNIPWDWRRKSR